MVRLKFRIWVRRTHLECRACSSITLIKVLKGRQLTVQRRERHINAYEGLVKATVPCLALFPALNMQTAKPQMLTVVSGFTSEFWCSEALFLGDTDVVSLQ